MKTRFINEPFLLNASHLSSKSEEQIYSSSLINHILLIDHRFKEVIFVMAGKARVGVVI